LWTDKFGTLAQTRLPDFRPTECLKNQKRRTAAISKTFNRLPFYLLKLQNLHEQTLYQFLFVVKKGCFETSNTNNKSKARKLNIAFKTSTDVTASTLCRSRRAAAILSAPPPTCFNSARRRRRRQFVGAPPIRCL